MIKHLNLSPLCSLEVIAQMGILPSREFAHTIATEVIETTVPDRFGQNHQLEFQPVPEVNEWLKKHRLI